jgi:hypothetical protein
MAKYVCAKIFRDYDGAWKHPGDPVEADDSRAAKLRYNKLIGGQYVESPAAKSVTKPEAKDKKK